MSIINWLNSPLESVVPFQRSLDRFFLDTLADIDSRITKRLDRAEDLYTPNIDISEDADNFYILAELPGLTEADLKITVDNDVLTIQGKKSRKEEKRERNYHRIERSFGEFIRSMSLPTNVKSEDIRAHFEGGLLELTLPKLTAKAPSAREIPLHSTASTAPRVTQKMPEKNGSLVTA